MTMYDDFDTQIQCEEFYDQDSPDNYEPNGHPSDPDDEDNDEAFDDQDDLDRDILDDDEGEWAPDCLPRQDMDDLSDWFKEDGGLTADAYEWLAAQDKQKGFC